MVTRMFNRPRRGARTRDAYVQGTLQDSTHLRCSTRHYDRIWTHTGFLSAFLSYQYPPLTIELFSSESGAVSRPSVPSIGKERRDAKRRPGSTTCRAVDACRPKLSTGPRKIFRLRRASVDDTHTIGGKTVEYFIGIHVHVCTHSTLCLSLVRACAKVFACPQGRNFL